MRADNLAASANPWLDWREPCGWLAANQRSMFWLAVAFSIAMMWMAPRLPMLDLAQHTAQVALWRDLISGHSAWADLVRINLVTPYLIGYGLMLPLSFIVPMDVAARMLLSLAFVGFILACQALRREFASDQRLEWLFLFPFFGYCWKWGFFTFLLASPLGLCLILLAVRHARSPTLPRCAGLVATGVFLLFSHGLMFVAAAFLSGFVMLEQLWVHRTRGFWLRTVPYVILFATVVIFRFVTMEMEGAIQNEGWNFGTPIWARAPVWLLSITDMDNYGTFLLPAASTVALWSPNFFRLKFNARPTLVLFGGLLVLLTFLPTDAFQTGLLYQRFALFLPPFIAFAFRSGHPDAAKADRSLLTNAGLILACCVVLGIQASRIYAFAAESRPFETVLEAAKPGKRAVALIFDPRSPAAANLNVYMHYVAWYQADKHGFVDFNFASFPPQIVRFRPGREPRQGVEFAWQPGKFAWADFDIRLYDYIFARVSEGHGDELIQNCLCELKVVVQDGPWILLERGECPVKS